MMLSDDHCCDNNVAVATNNNPSTTHEQNNGRRRRSDSLVVSDDSMTGALDALATLACSGGEIQALDDEIKANSSSSTHITPQSSDECCGGEEEDNDEDDDSETMMPPPPPRVSAIATGSSLSSSVTNDYLVGSGSILPTPPSPSKSSSYTFSFLHDSYYPASNVMSSSVEGTRIRSASNPEGMEKWDLYSHRNDRQHFVLPSSILEEELASTRRVLAEVEEVGGKGGWMGAMFSSQHNSKPGMTLVGGVGVRRSGREKRANTMRLGTSPDSVFLDMGEDNIDNNRVEGSVISTAIKSSSGNSKSKKKAATGSRGPSPKTITKSTPPVEVLEGDEDEEEEEDESLLEPEELLRRARSRLLEDLSEGGEHHGNGHGDGRIGGGSVLILPHSLSKYKEVSVEQFIRVLIFIDPRPSHNSNHILI